MFETRTESRTLLVRVLAGYEEYVRVYRVELATDRMLAYFTPTGNAHPGTLLYHDLL